MFDPAIPAPDEARIVYGTHAPIYTGDVAERVQAEMRRRVSLRGNASPKKPYRFSGLMVCANCGFNMSGHNRSNPKSLKNTYYCKSKYRDDYEIGCPSNPYYIHEPDVQEWFDQRLRDLLDGVDAFSPQDVSTGEVSLLDQIAALEAEIAAAEGTLQRLVLQAAQQTDPSLAAASQGAMEEAAELLNAKQSA